VCLAPCCRRYLSQISNMFHENLHIFFLVILGFELRALCLLSSHTSSLFLSSYFGDVMLETGSRFLPRPAWTRSSYFTLPAVAGMTGAHHHGVSQTFLPGLAWNCCPPDFSFPHCLGRQMHATVPHCWWDGVSWTFCLGWSWIVILLISAFQVATSSWPQFLLVESHNICDTIIKWDLRELRKWAMKTWGTK
jgi:hypothetical protein